jgi:hypothetical protein
MKPKAMRCGVLEMLLMGKQCARRPIPGVLKELKDRCHSSVYYKRSSCRTLVKEQGVEVDETVDQNHAYSIRTPSARCYVIYSTIPSNFPGSTEENEGQISSKMAHTTNLAARGENLIRQHRHPQYTTLHPREDQFSFRTPAYKTSPPPNLGLINITASLFAVVRSVTRPERQSDDVCLAKQFMFRLRNALLLTATPLYNSWNDIGILTLLPGSPLQSLEHFRHIFPLPPP